MTGSKETSGRAALRGAAVLVAEDNDVNRLVASQVLYRLGAQVDVATDGAEALSRLAARRYDLCLLDLEMPRLSGLEVLREARGAEGGGARTPIVVLTAYAGREHREQTLAAGADGMVAKPITSIEAFGDTIAAFMRSAPTVGTATDEEPVDREAFDDLAQTIGPESFAVVLERVEADLAAARARLVAAAPARDGDELHAASHVLISVAGGVGGVKLRELAQALNNAARSGALEEAAARADEVASACDELEAFIAARRAEEAGR